MANGANGLLARLVEKHSEKKFAQQRAGALALSELAQELESAAYATPSPLRGSAHGIRAVFHPIINK